MKILGYSERGLINSLIFNIGENKELMDKFIRLITFPTVIEIGEPHNYEILIEQSFSEFGNADLVIVVHYNNPTNKKVLFIEGKVKTVQAKTWSLKSQFDKFIDINKTAGYSSNLFFQLKSKELLVGTLNGNHQPDKYGKQRKLGSNDIVMKSIEKIKDASSYYYIGLIPSAESDIISFLPNLQQHKLPFHFLTWEKVKLFCIENKLNKVLENFQYNEGQIY